jgi:hypothetical protein
MIYFDCPRGVSGDMLLGALLDMEDGSRKLEKELLEAGLEGIKIKVEDKVVDGVKGAAAEITAPGKSLSTYREVREFSGTIKVDDDIKRAVEKTYALIFKAEAAVHNTTPEKVHLHELASSDTFIQILSYHILTDGQVIYSSALPVGTGTVKTAHGELPLPAPAAAEILKGIPVRVTSSREELTTPTAAAILKSSARFSGVENLIIEKTGVGMGARNFMRVFKADEPSGGGRGIYQAEVNIDDMTGEDVAFLVEKLSSFSREVYSTPVFMKKGRPGNVVTALVEEKMMGAFRDCLFLHSSTAGFRYFKVFRDVLKREIIKFKSSCGEVAIKVTSYNGRQKIKPEYDDLKKISKEKGIPISELRRDIIREYYNE